MIGQLLRGLRVSPLRRLCWILSVSLDIPGVFVSHRHLRLKRYQICILTTLALRRALDTTALKTEVFLRLHLRWAGPFLAVTGFCPFTRFLQPSAVLPPTVLKHSFSHPQGRRTAT